MRELGERLKAKRLEMNLSLKEVENSTSIRLSYLQAIETGDVSRLISHVYARGFVSQYANFLGLDGERIIAEHPEIFAANVNQVFAYGIGTLEHRGNHSGGVRGLPQLTWVLVFAAVLGAAWFFAKYLELF